MSWKNLVNLVAVVLLLGPSVSAMAQEPAPPPAAPPEAEKSTPPATMPMPGLVSTTNRVSAEVVQVDKTYLLVKLQSGEVRVFNVDPARVFIVDGKPLTVKQLKPGTILTATYTSTPPTGAPVATVTGKVWYVSGNTVILTLPDGTNKSYTVPASFQFMVNGEPASVSKLRKGMKVTAHRIPEPPAVEISHDIVVTGTTKK
ncbi:MAG TPA: hypothetical protein VFC25_00280 [Verrucomicrobiae bacterium]|nr:hypothetical protein [Verrucomicrobiae bacterium]